jgi:hypothetical protein
MTLILFTKSLSFYIFSFQKRRTHVWLTVTYIAQQEGEKVIEKVDLTYLSILCSFCKISKSVVFPVTKNVIVFQFPAHSRF